MHAKTLKSSCKTVRQNNKHHHLMTPLINKWQGWNADQGTPIDSSQRHMFSAFTGDVLHASIPKLCNTKWQNSRQNFNSYALIQSVILLTDPTRNHNQSSRLNYTPSSLIRSFQRCALDRLWGPCDTSAVTTHISIWYTINTLCNKKFRHKFKYEYPDVPFLYKKKYLKY